MLKLIISMLLCVVMVFSMVPVQAFSMEDVTEPIEIVTEPTEETTAPTEPVTEPTEETTAPTEPETESTEGETAPTKETDGGEPEGIPVESVTVSQTDSKASLAAGTALQQEKTVAVTSIEITAETDCIAPGETLQLTVTVLPENATNKDIIWSSHDESVLTVDENGLVTGVASGCTFVDVMSSGGNVTAQYEIAVFDETVMTEQTSSGAYASAYSGTPQFPLKADPANMLILTYGSPDYSYSYETSKARLDEYGTDWWGSHHGTFYYAMDISGTGANGKDVYPVAPGQVIYHGTTYGEVIIEHTVPLTLKDGVTTYNKWYSSYVHMANIDIPSDKHVDVDHILGTVSNAGSTAEHPMAVHLHFSLTTKLHENNNGKYNYHYYSSKGTTPTYDIVMNYAYATLNPKWVFPDITLNITCQDAVWGKTPDAMDTEAINRFNLGTEYAPGNVKNGKQYVKTFDPDNTSTLEEYLNHPDVVIGPMSCKYRPTNGGSIMAWKFPWKNSTGDEEAKKWGNVSGDLRVINVIQNHVGNTWFEIEPVGSQRRFVHSSEVTAVPGNKVTFDANGGTLKDVASNYHVESYKGWTYGPLPAASRDGYEFLGWYTAPTGGTSVDASTAVSKDSDHTLYAHWDDIEPYYNPVDVSNITEDNALITAKCHNPEGITLKMGGFYLRKKGDTEVIQKTDNIVGSYQTKAEFDCSYNLKNEYGITLEPGTTYEYRLYVADASGKEYPSTIWWYEFTTAGTAPSDPDISIDPPETISAAVYLAEYAKSTRNVKAVAVSVSGNPITTWKLPWTNNSSSNLKLGTVSGRINLIREVINHVGNTWYEYDTGSSTRGFIPESDIRILLKRTITLDANGGNCSTGKIVLVEGEQKLPLPVPTRSDYIFDGWFTAKEGGTQYVSGNTYTISKDITLYAHWTEASSVDPDVSISAADYLAQYAKKVTSINKTAVTVGNPITTWKLPWTNTKNGVQDASLKLGTVSGGITLIREVVNHAGNIWYEYETGTGTRGFVYHTDVSFETAKPYCTVKPHSEPTEDNTVLYTTWNNPSEITLTHGGFCLGTNPNNLTQYRETVASGWENETTIPCSYDLKNEYDVNLQPGTTYYYQFFIESSDGVIYRSEIDSFKTTGQAGTVEQKYTITLDPNGGSCDVNAFSVIQGQQILQLPTPTRSGYTFDGWFDQETNIQIISGSAYSINKNMTLCARWTQNEPEFPYCTVLPHSEPTEDNVVLYATWNNPSGLTLTKGGFFWGTSTDIMDAYGSDVVPGYETAGQIPCSYDLKNECGISLWPGTTYYYQFFIESDDEHIFFSDVKSFTTAGEPYTVIEDSNYWITENMTLAEKVLVAEGASVYIDAGVTVTVPAGIELNIQGYMEVYGNLIFEEGSILTITDESYQRLCIWTGKLDAIGADISGVPYGAVELQVNSPAEVYGIPDEMLYASIYVYNTSEINAALGWASDYEILLMMVDSSLTLTNSITIPDNTELLIWQWDSDADCPTVVIPNGITVTNNGWFTLDSGRLVVEEGGKLINNDYAEVRTFGLMLVHGEFQQHGDFYGTYYEKSMSQVELESELSYCAENGFGWIHENETIIESDMTIDLGEKEFRLSKYGSIIVADGATLTVNSSIDTGCWDYSEFECGKITVKNGGKLIINGDLQTYDTAGTELILEDGSYLEVNGRIFANDSIIIGRNAVVEVNGYWIGYAPTNNGGTILPAVTNISISADSRIVDPETMDYVTLQVSVTPDKVLGATWTSSDSDIIDPVQITDFSEGKYRAYPGEKSGTVTLIATSIDGSGEMASITLKVGKDVENRVIVPAAELNGQTSLWIDGAEYEVQTDGDTCYVDLPDGNARTMIVYTYHAGNASDIHTRYPVSMKVWTLSNTDGIYTTVRIEELDNILQYSGTSIRVTGKQGIRMITSIDKNKKNSLISDGLAGYTLKEYGSVVAWASQLENGNPLVLGQSYAMSNYAYKKGVADPVFAYNGNLMQYTNVLVGFSLDQCKNDLAMRPYMILTDAEGNEITLYGGVVQRSIGYIAAQNAYVFDAIEEANAYKYIWDIIRHVYGEDYVPEAA